MPASHYLLFWTFSSLHRPTGRFWKIPLKKNEQGCWLAFWAPDSCSPCPSVAPQDVSAACDQLGLVSICLLSQKPSTLKTSPFFTPGAKVTEAKF